MSRSALPFRLLAALLAMTAPAGAQTAGQLVSGSYAPAAVRPAGGGITLPDATGQPVPAGAELLQVTPAGLEVAGGLPDLAAATAEIEAGLRGRRVTAADLFAAASALEAAYVRAGYPLVRVSLPPQTIRDGEPLKLEVTRGQLAEVETGAFPARVAQRLDAHLRPLIGRSDIRQGELETRLLRAGDTPGVMLRSALAPGALPGTANLLLDGVFNPVVWSLGVDNGPADTLGDWQVSAGVDLNNLLGLGEIAYLRLTGDPALAGPGFLSPTPRNRQIAAGLTLPLGTGGVWLNLEAVDSRTHPTSTLPFTLPGHYRRASVGLGYDWLRRRSFNASTIASFDAIRETQSIDYGGTTFAFSDDRLRVLRLTQTADARLPTGGYLSGQIALSLGLDALGARRGTAALPLSRAGAAPAFRKLSAQFDFEQPLAGDRLTFGLRGAAQTSFGDPLVASEQMSLGGIGALSAFDGGALTADSGAWIRADLGLHLDGLSSLPIGNGAQGAVVPYVFAGYGVAHLARPTAVERGVTRAYSVGGGVKFGLTAPGSVEAAALTVEFAHGGATGRRASNRLSVALRMQF